MHFTRVFLASICLFLTVNAVPEPPGPSGAPLPPQGSHPNRMPWNIQNVEYELREAIEASRKASWSAGDIAEYAEHHGKSFNVIDTKVRHQIYLLVTAFTTTAWNIRNHLAYTPHRIGQREFQLIECANSRLIQLANLVMSAAEDVRERFNPDVLLLVKEERIPIAVGLRNLFTPIEHFVAHSGPEYGDRYSLTQARKNTKETAAEIDRVYKSLIFGTG